jgi:hypothetical protein
VPEPSVNRRVWSAPRLHLVSTIMAGAKSQLHSLSTGLIALALLTAPDVHKADCGNLADRYTAAAAKVIDALRSYEKCVSSGDKHDACAAEMQALDNAHDDFADAVADSKSCR